MQTKASQAYLYPALYPIVPLFYLEYQLNNNSNGFTIKSWNDKELGHVESEHKRVFVVGK